MLLGKDFDAAADILSNMSPQERFNWAAKQTERPVLTTSFGPRAIASLDMYAKAADYLNRKLTVLCADTGFISPKTVLYAAEIQRRYKEKLNFEVARSGASAMEIIFNMNLYTGDKKNPIAITKDQAKEIGRLTKEKALCDAFDRLGVTAWISGLAPDEEKEDRKIVRFITYAHKFNGAQTKIPKICPYADRDRAWLYKHIASNDLPVNEDVGDWTREYTGELVCGANLPEMQGAHI